MLHAKRSSMACMFGISRVKAPEYAYLLQPTWPAAPHFLNRSETQEDRCAIDEMPHVPEQYMAKNARSNMQPQPLLVQSWLLVLWILERVLFPNTCETASVQLPDRVVLVNSVTSFPYLVKTTDSEVGDGLALLNGGRILTRGWMNVLIWMEFNVVFLRPLVANMSIVSYLIRDLNDTLQNTPQRLGNPPCTPHLRREGATRCT